MKSRAGYFLAPLLFIAGLAAAGWLVWFGVTGLQDALNRFVVPGTKVLTLDKRGSYTIFHESDSVVDGKLYSAPTVAGLQVTVTGEDDKPLTVTEAAYSSSYSIGGHSGKSVLAFDVITPGRFRLAAAYSTGQTGPQTVLAVGHGFVGNLVRTIFTAIGVAFAGFGAALALILTTYFRRRRLLRTP